MSNNEDLNTKIWANLPDEVHTYFFRKVFAGDRGVKQELVIDFFTALHRHCLGLGIPADWDMGSNGKRVRALVKSIKFDEPKPKPTRPRRASRTPSKSPPQPPPSRDVPGTTHRTSEASEESRSIGPDPNSQTKS
jgi:hypothetical protein